MDFGKVMEKEIKHFIDYDIELYSNLLEIIKPFVFESMKQSKDAIMYGENAILYHINGEERAKPRFPFQIYTERNIDFAREVFDNFANHLKENFTPNDILEYRFNICDVYFGFTTETTVSIFGGKFPPLLEVRYFKNAIVNLGSMVDNDQILISGVDTSMLYLLRFLSNIRSCIFNPEEKFALKLELFHALCKKLVPQKIDTIPLSKKIKITFGDRVENIQSQKHFYLFDHTHRRDILQDEEVYFLANTSLMTNSKVEKKEENAVYSFEDLNTISKLYILFIKKQYDEKFNQREVNAVISNIWNLIVIHLKSMEDYLTPFTIGNFQNEVYLFKRRWYDGDIKRRATRIKQLDVCDF